MTDRPFPARHFPATLLIAGCVCFSASFAQTPGDEVSGETDATEEPVGESREVDVNEDNYRRFMELPDDRIQRRSLPPIDSFKPSSLEKMENLPEASQKHLRNQLREVIVQQEAWTPDAAGELYPYVPSTAARSDRELQKQETEAWRELVANYHEREAAIYANTNRSQAASMSGTPESGGSAGAGNAGPGEPGDGGGQNENEGAQTAQSGTVQGVIKPGAAQNRDSNGEESVSTAGVSQNALEFLTAAGVNGKLSQAGSPGAQNTPETAGQSSAETEQAEANQSGQPAPGSVAGQSSPETEQFAEDGTVTETREGSAGQPSASASESMQESGEPRAAGEKAVASKQEKTSSEVVYISKGTLAIKDLSRAQGVIRPDQSPPSAADKDGDSVKPADEKDGDG